MQASFRGNKSLFDIIEERSEKPENFEWTTEPSLLSYNPEEILHKGTLLTLQSSYEIIKTNCYILTLRGLIKCKVMKHLKSLIEIRNSEIRAQI